jgi:hypothetical protein
MTEIPGTSKAWRSGVLEVFFDVRFFDCSSAAGAKWGPLITAALDVDRDRLADIISKRSPFPSLGLTPRLTNSNFVLQVGLPCRRPPTSSSTGKLRLRLASSLSGGSPLSSSGQTGITTFSSFRACKSYSSRSLEQILSPRSYAGRPIFA